ncbi:hypothetical protein GCM10020256_41900 [Streptomyces thermocoprophilus]
MLNRRAASPERPSGARGTGLALMCAVDAPSGAGMQWAQAPASRRDHHVRFPPSTPGTPPDPTQEHPTEQPAEVRNLMLIGACGCGSGCGCGCQSGSPCQCG